MKNTLLCELKKGEQAKVLALGCSGAIRRRLQDIGVVPGTQVECLYYSPLGDPTAFLIRGALIALRRADSKEISVEVPA